MKDFLITSFVILYCLLNIKAQSPFNCEGKIFFSQADKPITNLYELQFTNNSSTLLIDGNIPLEYNALSYHTKNHFIYGLVTENNTLIKIGQNGNYKSLGVPQNMPNSFKYWSADFNRNGEYILTGGSDTRILKIDVSNDQPKVISSVNKFYTSNTYTGEPTFSDIAFDPMTGICYGFDSRYQRLSTINPETGAIDVFGTFQNNLVGGVGAIFFTPKGELYGVHRTQLYKVDKTTGNIQFIDDNFISRGGIDGCSCPLPLKIAKNIFQENICLDDTLDVLLTFDNKTGAMITDASLSDAFPSFITISSIPTNPLGGTIQTGTGIGTNQLRITQMNIPIGISILQYQIIVSGTLSKTTEVKTQASLFNLPNNLPDSILSDFDITPIPLVPDSTSFTIEVINNDWLITTNTPLCESDDLLISIDDESSYSYEWVGPMQFSNTISNFTIENIKMEQAGFYYLNINPNSNCPAYDSILIEVNPNPTVFIGNDTSLCLRDIQTFSLNPNNTFTNYIWSDGSEEAILPISEYGNFWLQVSDSLGCNTIDSISIVPNCESFFYIPNVFSPNNDDRNDEFTLFIEDVNQFHLQIYNRWGALVFESSDINHRWDGLFRGKDAQQGVYVYWVKWVDSFNKEYFEYGDITLLRN